MFKAAILGAPASGKGTISARIIKHFDIIHVSSGDMLRNQIKNGTDLGREVNQYIKNGKLVPDSVMVRLVSKELENLKDKNWLLDGFPRTRSQAETLFQKNPLQLAVNLVVPFQIIIDRVKGRWVHIPSGRVYNTDYNAPKVFGRDDVTGEDLEQRPDDRPEAVRKRLEIYSETVEPLLEYYRNKGVLRECHGNTSDEIWPQVRKVLTEFIKQKI